ncbi:MULTISPECIES: hypothetical protein [Pirellulaceae]|uniref:hypothetical protein n=1 Tax=Pirellulaceae TaxID=2691357 RepID=UPI001304C31F|nr:MULTISPECIES: hypothetical protein [Pirellulaceae]
MNTVSSKPKPYVIAFAAWLAAVVFVFVSLGVYAGTQGPRSLPPSQWPTSSNLERTIDSHTLLVFLHPGCPCSRATLDNLLPISTTPSLSIVLVCMGDEFHPGENANDFASCRQQLNEWKTRNNVSLHFDTKDEEAHRFQAKTSGHCMLFNAQGKLKFSGGVTSSRGHQGASAGLASLEAALNGSPEYETYPVFGCPLHSKPHNSSSNDIAPTPKRLLPACCKGNCRA